MNAGLTIYLSKSLRLSSIISRKMPGGRRVNGSRAYPSWRFRGTSAFFSGLHRIRPIIASNETNFVCNFWVGCAYRAADTVHELGGVLKKCLIVGSSEHSESPPPWLLER